MKEDDKIKIEFLCMIVESPMSFVPLWCCVLSVTLIIAVFGGGGAFSHVPVLPYPKLFKKMFYIDTLGICHALVSARP